MTAVLTTRTATRPVTIRPAPRREPPFDDELPEDAPFFGRHDRRLPFELTAVPAPVWRPRPARPRGLPDPSAWGRRLLVGMIETASGRRPLHQLAAMLSPSVSRGIGADFERAARQGGGHWLHRAGVRSVRVAEPADGVAELCATVETGRRVRAVAMRLEEHQGRWRCTRLQLG
jgi:uncharacterized protein DUF6459